MNLSQIKSQKLKIMNIKNKNFLLKSFFIIYFSFILKIDFRFENGIFCCGDDYDYFSHAQTIAEDFDLDYSNQLEGFEDKRYNQNGKVAPKGFWFGLLASPFLFIGNVIESFIQSNNINSQFFKLQPSSVFFIVNFLYVYDCSFDKKMLNKVEIKYIYFEVILFTLHLELLILLLKDFQCHMFMKHLL